VLTKDLFDVLAVLGPVLEGLDDTLKALGTELMHQADECYGYLKVAAKKSASQNLNDAVKKIAAQLKQGPRKTSGNSPAASS
jgi:hypothetical protein